jgi:putative colanic acid biosynthesis acetyltransferase WcaF
VSTTDLSRFDNSDFNPGRPISRILWFIVLHLFFTNPLFPFMAPKRLLLKLFGAKVGKGLIIKPRVNIKYPWNLTIGDHVWIGEEVWIDNLVHVVIGDNVCLSQRCTLICGNHDYKRATFDLITGTIVIEAGAWIGAGALVGPGVKMGSHAILSIGSVTTTDIEPYAIYRGNPAVRVRDRVINER